MFFIDIPEFFFDLEDDWAKKFIIAYIINTNYLIFMFLYDFLS